MSNTRAEKRGGCRPAIARHRRLFIPSRQQLGPLCNGSTRQMQIASGSLSPVATDGDAEHSESSGVLLAAGAHNVPIRLWFHSRSRSSSTTAKCGGKCHCNFPVVKVNFLDVFLFLSADRCGGAANCIPHRVVFLLPVSPCR